MNRVTLFFLLLSFSINHFSEESISDPANPEESILFWEKSQKINGFRNGFNFVPSRVINKSSSPYPLNYLLLDFSQISYELNGKTYTLEDYNKKFNVAGMMIVRRGNILHEQYNFGNNKDSKWISFSVTKSVTSMLLGAAIKDGYIKNIKDPVTKYLPELSGSNYDKISIKHILQMSSGIKWNEDYEDPYSDVNLAAGLNSSDLYKYLSKLDIAHKPGRKFNYNTAESNLIGGIVRSAVGSNLSNYLESKIWKPFGMESDAHWALDNTFLDELGGCCIYATLKDYTRIGIFALKQGKLLNGTEVLPKKWIRDSTKASKAYRHYGYQWWLSGPPYKSYYAQGIFGQMIWIDPPTATVIVIHSASDKAWTPEADQHKFALLTAIMIKLYNL